MFKEIPDGSIIGFDTETYDPHLKEDGPGWARGHGHLVGFSIATMEWAHYYPIHHTHFESECYDRTQSLEYLKDVLENPRIIKVGANLLYDYGWCSEVGILPQGESFDVQFAEALLDSNALSVALDYLGEKYCNERKQDSTLYQWCADTYRGKPDRNQAGNIWRAPPRLVRPYAEQDARLPLRVFFKQAPLIEAAGLEDLYRMECALIPLLIAIRRRGMHVDRIRASETIDELKYTDKLLRKQLESMVGERVNINSGKQLAPVFDKLGIVYPRTDKGNPSFPKEWLRQQTHPVAKLIVEIRGINKTHNDFLQKSILDKEVDGRIYPSLHPLRSDESGTITGRFSSTKPNGQQFPSRDAVLAPLVRGCFIPDDGFPSWIKMDFSQIEYRFLAHYAMDYGVTGSRELVAAYQQRTADFHKIVQSDILGLSDSFRKPVKNINFMKVYGGGRAKVKSMLTDVGIDMDPDEFIDVYEEKFPAASALMKAITDEINSYGEIRTILNRRTTFGLYVPAGEFGHFPLPYDKAYFKWGPNLEVANAYKGTNYKLQGSAADCIKKGMLMAWKSGLFKRAGVPHIQVHDELDFSYHPDLHSIFMEIKECMEDAIHLHVPVIMDMDIGDNWGDCG